MVPAIDVDETRTFALKWPAVSDLELSDFVIEYDRCSDTLVVAFAGLDRPTIGVATSDCALLRVDPVTEEVVGFELEHFLKASVALHPAFFDVLHFVDVTPRERARAEKAVEARGGWTGSAKSDAASGLLIALRQCFGPNGSSGTAVGAVRP